MKTIVVDSRTISRAWYVVDATDQMIGRLASKVANILIGAQLVAGEKAKLSGTKMETKRYFRHSKYPGGEKFRSFKEQMALDPTKVIVHAVHGMVPKNALGRSIMTKLHVYKDAGNPHVAQKPTPITL